MQSRKAFDMFWHATLFLPALALVMSLVLQLAGSMLHGAKWLHNCPCVLVLFLLLNSILAKDDKFSKRRTQVLTCHLWQGDRQE